MFMLWAIPIGILAGLVAHGKLDNLSRFRFRWAGLALAGLAVQLVLFTRFGDALAGSFGPAIYVASTAGVLLAVLRNIRIPGMAIVALGSVSNLAAVTANGGFMPASAEALATAGLDGPGSHTNSVVLESPVLEPLTDIFALPAWMPLANVFSIGDVLIGLGLVIVIVAVMRGHGAGPANSDTNPAASGPDRIPGGVEPRSVSG